MRATKAGGWKSVGLGLAWAVSAGVVFAATTGTTQLHMQQGAGAGTGVGDYVSDAGGLNTYYSFFIEVPPNLSRLVVDIFDADWGLGGAGEAALGHDRARNTTFNSSAAFSLLNPSGTAQTINFATSDATNPAGADNAWLTLFDTNSIYPTFVAAASTTVSATTVSVTPPAGTATGDVMIAVVARDLDGATGTVTAPAGWTLVNEGDCPTASCALAVYQQAITGAVPGAQSFSWTGTQAASAAILSFRGVDTTTPLDVVATVATGTTNNPVSPSITTANYGTMLVRLVGAGPNLAFTPPGGYTEPWDAGAGGGGADQVRGTAAYATQGAAGASGTATFTAAVTRWRALTVALRRASPLAAGHWELRIDSNNTGDDINALGIRAHDGDTTSGGTEIPVYADSFFSYGVNTEETGTASTRVYAQYPWFTEGCRIEINTFDWDSGSSVPAPLTNTGSITLTSRTGSFSQVDQPLSTNNAWDNVQLNAFTSNANSTDYGIWTQTTQINEYLPAGNSNYGDTYLGDDGLPNPPPTSQPVTDAFRLYLPTDAGTAPVKPYLEQQLRWTCAGSGISGGPNPPTVGQTSCFTVTVRLTNPTSRAITFSTPTNIVTATVPGTTVLYAGGAAVSQGSVVSAPAIAGSGDITWNPGSVAGGATALLSYWVRVTPAAAGTVVVTATHASGNGTRARYVDETGNTTQARATYELGPLCELAASTTAATPAVVFGLGAEPVAGGVAVRWETASEVGSSRFELERLESDGQRWTRVDDGRLAADPAIFQGSIYRVLDRGADARTTLTYRVVEVDVRGRRQIHGPYRLLAEVRPDSLRASDAPVEPRALAVRERLAVGEQPREDRVAAGLKIGIAAAGIVRLPAAQIADGLGLPISDVTARLRSQGFALTLQGQPVAWMPTDGGDGLLFFGEGVDSPYSREAVYVLQVGTGKPIKTSGGNPGPFEALPWLSAQALAEKDRVPVLVLPADPDSDYWYWQALLATVPGSASGSFVVAAPSAVAGRPATLRVRLAGATPESTGEHRVRVTLNGAALGEIAFAGLGRSEATLAVPAGVLRGGDNVAELDAQVAPGGTANDVFVDGFALDYLSYPIAVSDRLEVRSFARATVAIRGFADRRVRVFDVTDPLAPRLLKEAMVTTSGDGYAVSFSGANRLGRYLAVSPQGWGAASWIRPDYPSNLRQPSRGADYLIIAPSDLVPSATRLAMRRESEGLSTAVVDLEDVYDEFAGGLPTPHALHDFLAYARGAWEPAPRYVLLAGNGDFDYRGLLGYGGNLVPPLLVETPDGLFASDARLADVVGDDGIPDLAIGRLPVRTVDEMDAYVTKLVASETAYGTPSGRALLVADDPQPGFDFAADLDTFAGWLPRGFLPQRVALTPGNLGTARAALFSGLAAGADLLLFSGHAGLDRLTSEGLLTTADLASLPTVDETPIIVALTCVLNRFELPMLAPLGAQLVTAPGSGALAVWSATGLSTHPAAPRLARYFLDEMGRTPGARLGDPMLSAQQRFAAAEGSALLAVYNLLGDPASRLAAPPPPNPPLIPPGKGVE